jgi:transcriptional regulator with PAS, ATPase and Fis domain
MKQVYELATLAAQNDSPVILEGETGTGKGMLAKWIHQQSNRKDFAFIEINCSSLKGDLLASELFGHARGAFTSAVQDRQGLLEVADGGTLFLDEIGDMDLGVQAQFLKVIEEKQFRRLGEVKLRRSEFRTICATNQNLIQKIKEGSFRKNLYSSS